MTDLDWASVQDVVEFPIAVGGRVVLSGRRRLRDGAARDCGCRRGSPTAWGSRSSPGGGCRQPISPQAPSRSRSSATRSGGIGLPRVRARSAGCCAPSQSPVRASRRAFASSASSRRTSTTAATAARRSISWCAHVVPIRTYMVRLREGIPPAAAEQRLTDAARRAATSPIPGDWSGVQLESARERWLGTLRPVLFGVTAASGLVLVIVCANVAVLMLLRSMQRQREVAVRLALGSAWRHVVTDAARGNVAHLWCGARARRGAHRVPARHARAARRNAAGPSGPGGVGHRARHDRSRDGRSRQPARGRGALSGAADGVGPGPDECAAAGCTGGDRRALDAARAQRADRVRGCRLARAARRLRTDDPQRRPDDGRRSRVRAARALGIPHHAARAPLSRRRRVSPFSRAVCRRALDGGRRAGRVQQLAAFRAAAGARHRAGRRTARPHRADRSASARGTSRRSAFRSGRAATSRPRKRRRMRRLP